MTPYLPEWPSPLQTSIEPSEGAYKEVLDAVVLGTTHGLHLTARQCQDMQRVLAALGVIFDPTEGVCGECNETGRVWCQECALSHVQVCQHSIEYEWED